MLNSKSPNLIAGIFSSIPTLNAALDQHAIKKSGTRHPRALPLMPEGKKQSSLFAFSPKQA
jgi:hypothetical protein